MRSQFRLARVVVFFLFVLSNPKAGFAQSCTKFSPNESSPPYQMSGTLTNNGTTFDVSDPPYAPSVLLDNAGISLTSAFTVCDGTSQFQGTATGSFPNQVALPRTISVTITGSTLQATITGQGPFDPSGFQVCDITNFEIASDKYVYDIPTGNMSSSHSFQADCVSTNSLNTVDISEKEQGSGTWPISAPNQITVTLRSPSIEPFNQHPVAGQLPPSTTLVGVTVSVTDSTNASVPNYAVNLSISPQDLMNAGHAHTNTSSAPVGVLSDSSGTFVDTCTTGSAGEPCELFYAPDVVSGVFAITATSATDSAVSASAAINVMVLGLQVLPTTSVYRMTGAVTGRHTMNHYSGTYLGQVVPLIAGIYNTFETEIGFSTPTLGINDLSLPWGGLFDLDALWDNASGHNLHRDGRSVDIDHLDGSNSPTDEPFLDLIAGSFGLYRIPEGPKSIHYQSPF